MKKKLCNLLLMCTLGIIFSMMFCITAFAQDIGLPPSNYLQKGQYPAGTVKNYYYYSNVTNSQRKLVVYTPPGYNTNQKYPVVYSIHGIDNTPESIFQSWGADASIVCDNLIGSGQIEPTIIVAWDNNNIDTHKELFDNILPYVENTFSVVKDADHRAIYGYSMGGAFAFAEGMGNLDVFHHVCPTSALPALHPSDDQMFQGGSNYVKQRLKTLILSCGTSDWCGFYPSNLNTHNYCVQHNINHYWMSVQGGNHDSGVWAPAMYYLLKYAFPKNGATNTYTPSQPTPTNIASLPDGTYYIKGVDSGKYLTVANNQAGASVNVEIRSLSYTDGQKWKLTHTNDGYITLQSNLGNFMLDVDRAMNNDGQNIAIYHAYSGDAQKFILNTTNNGQTYSIGTKVSNNSKMIDVNENGKNDGSNVIQWSANGGANQQWIFEKAN